MNKKEKSMLKRCMRESTKLTDILFELECRYKSYVINGTEYENIFYAITNYYNKKFA